MLKDSPSSSLPTSSAQLLADNGALREDNIRLRKNLSDVIAVSQKKIRAISGKIAEYEATESKRLDEAASLKACLRLEYEEREGELQKKMSDLEVAFKEKLVMKEQELALMNQILGKKQEDFLFGVEQLKDIKCWARKTISELAVKARDEISRRDEKILECEKVIRRKEDKIDETVKLLGREKIKCEKIVLETDGLASKLETDMELKLRAVNREVEKAMEFEGQKAWGEANSR